MFNNFVNIHDFFCFFEKGNYKSMKEISSVIFSKQRIKIEKNWSHIQNQESSWWNIPKVKERFNFLISGSSEKDFCEYITNKFLSDNNDLNALSLACGTGHKELKWAGTGRFKCIDAYDMSERRIRYATDQAIKHKLDSIINYRDSDVYDLEISNGLYDTVFAEQSLHHFRPVEEILIKVKNALKSTGYFIVNDFFGPTRFQWTDRQIEVVNSILSILPEKYKRMNSKGDVKNKVYKPGRLRMILGDPSEAVESSRIMPLLERHFKIVEMKEYGGTILHLLFRGIAHNFMLSDSKTMHFLDLCFEIEDILLQTGDLKSDFAIVVCQRKQG